MVDLSSYHDLYAQESDEHVATLRAALAQLRRDGGDGQALQRARMAAHSLKGISLTMGFGEPAALAGDLENQLALALEDGAALDLDLIAQGIAALAPAIQAALA